MNILRKISIIVLPLLTVMLIGAPALPTYAGGHANRADVRSSPSSFQEVLPYNVYLPVVSRNYPPSPTVFGVGMGEINASGGLDLISPFTTWVRSNNVLWASIEPNQGDRNWDTMAGLEQEMINASANHLQMILIVNKTPLWARQLPDYPCGPVLPEKLPAFGNFIYDLVSRYSKPPYNIKYWEIWNEPDVDPAQVSHSVLDSILFGCWGNEADPYYGGGYYADMLKVIYPRIKAADPDARVVVGGLLLDCDPRGSPSVCASIGHSERAPRFMEGILRNNGAPYFDGVSFHAYDYYFGQLGSYANANWQAAWNTTGPSLIAKYGYLKSLLDQYGVSGKFLMDTESAVFCDSCTNDSTFEATKAYFLAESYASAIAKGLKANVWYNVMGSENSGLLNSDLSVRPAYTALQVSHDELGGASWIRDITEYPNVKGYEFQQGNHHIWFIWSLDGNPHLITLPGLPLAVRDSLGNPIPSAASLNVGLNPLYLEWSP